MSWNGEQYIVAGQAFEKMRKNNKESEKNPQYILTPEEVKSLLRRTLTQNKKVPSRLHQKKKSSSDKHKKFCTIT